MKLFNKSNVVKFNVTIKYLVVIWSASVLIYSFARYQYNQDRMQTGIVYTEESPLWHVTQLERETEIMIRYAARFIDFRKEEDYSNFILYSELAASRIDGSFAGLVRNSLEKYGSVLSDISDLRRKLLKLTTLTPDQLLKLTSSSGEFYRLDLTTQILKTVRNISSGTVQYATEERVFFREQMQRLGRINVLSGFFVVVGNFLLLYIVIRHSERGWRAFFGLRNFATSMLKRRDRSSTREFRRSGAALFAMNERLREYFSDTPITISRFDRSGQMLSGASSRRAALMPSSHVIGVPLAAGDAATPAMDDLMQQVRTSQGWLGQFSVRRANGTTEYFVGKIAFSSAAKRHFFGIAIDVTEYERTRRAALVSGRMAALGELASSIAHELNQPINVIALAAANAQRALSAGSAAGSTVEQRLLRISEQARRASGIIERMKRLSRDGSLEKQEINLLDIVPEVVAQFASGIQPDRVRFISRNDSAPLKVIGDGIALGQVITNLVQNALDAVSNRQWPRIVVTRLRRDGGNAQFYVYDNGGGVPGDVEDRIFEPFFTTKAVDKGTGLGLALSRTIIQQHGGEIYFRNRNGGAVFVFVLPLKDDQQA